MQLLQSPSSKQNKIQTYAEEKQSSQKIKAHRQTKDGGQTAEDFINRLSRHALVMDKGSYRGPRINYNHYAVSRFVPHLFSAKHNFGCGPSALGLLTGVDPQHIKRRHNEVHYSDRYMVIFLRRHGFEVLKLTQCNVSRNDSFIGANHLVLVSQLWSTNEGTWGIIFGGAYYHNFKVYALDELSMLNKPIISAYLICDPRFRLFKKSLCHPTNLKGQFELKPSFEGRVRIQPKVKRPKSAT